MKKLNVQGIKVSETTSIATGLRKQRAIVLKSMNSKLPRHAQAATDVFLKRPKSIGKSSDVKAFARHLWNSDVNSGNCVSDNVGCT
jgi:hypothetical protein